MDEQAIQAYSQSHPTDWGRWHLRTESVTLVHIADEDGTEYHLDLETIKNRDMILDWMLHINEKKTPFDAADIGNLFEALNSIFDIRQNLLAGQTIQTQEFLAVRFQEL